MKYIAQNAELELKYVPNKGAWTYHIEIPDSKDIVGRWGYLKASGTIDNYKIEDKNLFTIKGRNKLMSVNDKIRKAINKTGGDMVTVTLYISAPNEQITEKQILEAFNESDVLIAFEKLSSEQKSEIINNILSQKSEDNQLKAIIKHIDELSK